MSSLDDSVTVSAMRRFALLNRVATSPRLFIYSALTALVLFTAYHLGQEMLWDTLDYHLYAGFAALHDRFGKDYFAAAPESYLNPYAYAPFYLLATSSLTALQVSLILATAQSAILWLTYELGAMVMSPEQPKVMLAVGLAAALLAFENPILINQFGSSFADVTTAVIVVAGWFLIATAIRSPGATRVVFAGLLLGSAAALKMTNSLAAIGALAALAFLPGGARPRFRLAVLFSGACAAGFVLVSAPWSIKLEREFGNPLFPLLNGIFRSPEYPTASVLDYRFLPVSFVQAILRPFAIASPRYMIHVESAAPDLRYALLATLAIVAGIKWAWWPRVANPNVNAAPGEASATRVLWALGFGFVVTWVLWLTVSGNSRYFIPMACIAAVLGVALVFRLFARYPKIRNYVLTLVLALQAFQLYAGTEFHAPIPWSGRPWFDVSVPQPIASKPSLYLSIGVQSSSYVLPYLARGSGFINLEGVYTLGAGGVNGRRIAALIKKYSPSVRVLVREPRPDSFRQNGYLQNVNDALQPFGLRVNPSDCLNIAVSGITPEVVIGPGEPPVNQRDRGYGGYLLTCGVVKGSATDPSLIAGERSASLALDHLEDACPELFQPRRPVTYLLGDKASGYLYVRRYGNTDITAWVSRKWVRFQKLIGGHDQEQYAGPERAWERAPLKVACGRTVDGDFLRVLQPLR